MRYLFSQMKIFAGSTNISNGHELGAEYEH